MAGIIRHAAPSAIIGLYNAAEYAVLLTGDEAGRRARIASQVHTELTVLLGSLESASMRALVNERVGAEDLAVGRPLRSSSMFDDAHPLMAVTIVT